MLRFNKTEDYPLGHTMPLPRRKHLKPGEKVLLSLAVLQVENIVAHISVGEGLLATLYAAKVWDDVVAVRCTLDELAELAACVEAEANNTTDKERRQDLDAICDAITIVEQRYWVRPRVARIARSN